MASMSKVSGARSDCIVSQFTATSSRSLLLKTADQSDVVEHSCFLSRPMDFYWNSARQGRIEDSLRTEHLVRPL